jgi:hypothetical protein
MLATLRREKPDNYADAAAALYAGCLMHARLQPIGHRFSNRVTSLLIDLDQLADANRIGAALRQPRSVLQSLRGMRPVPRQSAAFNTGLASGKINDYTSPALSTRAEH